MNRNEQRRTFNGEAITNEQNHGTMPMISKCTCCGKPMIQPVFSMASPIQPNGFWYEKKHLMNHEASADRIGKSESKSTENCYVTFTVKASDKQTMEYLISSKIYSGLNVKGHGAFVIYNSVLIVNYCSINKVLSGLIASDCLRKVIITYTDGTKVITTMEKANDAMNLGSAYIKAKNLNKKAEWLRRLTEIATIE